MHAEIPRTDNDQSGPATIEAPSSAPASSRPTFEYASNASPIPPVSTDSSVEPNHGTVPPWTPTAAVAPGARAEAADTDDGSTGPARLTLLQKSEIRQKARDRAKTASSQEWLTTWIANQGVPQDEAVKMGAIAWNTAQSTNKAALAQQRQDTGLAWAEIIGGVILLIIGLSAGWFVGLFLVPVVDGIRRLGN